MSNKDIYLLNNIENENILYSELNDIIENVKSTKIGNIIHFLKTSINKQDKVILFSQWDELLHKVGNIIEKYNITPLYCNGTVYKRKKAINQFCRDSSYNLIMLSSKNCASGINLTIANKIIFLEPIYGTQDYRYNIESQAIGRCDRISQTRPIEIYHFIIKDTIEEDIINNLIDDSQMTIKI
jgi:SNF2 family DNA or RNA helicase